MALFNKQFLKAVTLIEDDKQSIATGFIVGFLVNSDPDPSKRKYRLFLLTNRHVFNNYEQLSVRFDKKNRSETASFPILLKDEKGIKWLAHEDSQVDLAMLAINPNILNENDVDWRFIGEELFAYPEKYEEIGIELGDGVFLSGFPMGLSGVYQNHAIVRGGVIARFDDEIIKSERSILIDAAVFPGNSGGPVFLKPEQVSLENTKAVSSTYLIGVVSGYKLYKEPLYSHQTNPPSVAAISIENSGLASIVPMNYAKEIFNEFIKDEVKLEKEIRGDEKIIGDKIDTTLHS